MTTSFNHAGLVRLQGDGKALRRADCSLTQTQALDLVAQREGFTNWALLRKHAVTPSPDASLKATLAPFEGGQPGVYVLKLVVEPDFCAAYDGAQKLSFELPAVPQRWIVRRFTEQRDFGADKYLENIRSVPHGRFEAGKFFCIVSTNGLQPHEIDAEVALGLGQVAIGFRLAAVQALEHLAGRSAIETARLFYSVANAKGIQSLVEKSFPSAEDAMNGAREVAGHPIAVTAGARRWAFQPAFGWSEIPSA